MKIKRVTIKDITDREYKPSLRLRKKIRSRFVRAHRKMLLRPTIENLVKAAKARWREDCCMTFQKWYGIEDQKKDHIKWFDSQCYLLKEKNRKKEQILAWDFLRKKIRKEAKAEMKKKNFIAWTMTSWKRPCHQNKAWQEDRAKREENKKWAFELIEE